MPIATDQVLVDSIVELNTPAVKIDEIRAMIRDATCHVINNKVIYQGFLHKQIFYVREPDNVVVHQAEDIPFSGFVDVLGADPTDTCEVMFEIAFVQFDLLEPTVLRQKVLIDVFINVTERIIPIPVNGEIPVPVNGGNGGNGGGIPVTVTTSNRSRQNQSASAYVQGIRDPRRGRSARLSSNPARQGSGRATFKAVQKRPVHEYIARP